ncbi:MAG: hypothetical protein R6V55_15865 [Desulfovermiculus sp.]
MSIAATPPFITDQPGKFAFFARFGAKNFSDLPEARLNSKKELAKSNSLGYT